MANEKRLIDANDACESLCKNCGIDRGECERIGFCADYMDIKRLPTVDAVEVVRCKDCKHCSVDTMFGSCWCHGFLVKLDHFCSYGERREGE